jgi:hypothetical protein
MSNVALRAEPRPFEEVLIASTLENAQGQETLMGTIHHLSQERAQLQIQLSRHPWSDREAAARIQAITSELESCWAEVRRRRAAQRVRLEEALGVDPAAFEKTGQQEAQPETLQQTQPKRGRGPRLWLAHAS